MKIEIEIGLLAFLAVVGIALTAGIVGGSAVDAAIAIYAPACPVNP